MDGLPKSRKEAAWHTHLVRLAANPKIEMEWYIAEREKNRALARAVYKANPEKNRARKRAWRAANPEKVREAARAARAARAVIAEKTRAEYLVRLAAERERVKKAAKRYTRREYTFYRKMIKEAEELKEIRLLAREISIAANALLRKKDG
jgi:flagellum-specific peptidoglycan hydrolase FlgJ